MSFRNKSCLVTGGAGFIGSNLAIRLVERGAKVTVLDSMVEGLGGNRFNLEPIKGDIEFHEGDQKDQGLVERLVEGKDYIFNLAGNVSHSDSMKLPRFDLDANVTAQLSLLEACKSSNPEAVVVYSSTRQLYGVPKYLPVDESHPITPVDINGIHKFAGDQYHFLYAKVYGLKTIVLRLTNTFGPRQLIRHARQGVVGWFMNRAITGEKIQLYGNGKQIRDFNYVDDAAEALMLVAQNKACYGEVFNLSGERADLEAVATTLARIAGRGGIERVSFPPDAKKIDIGDFYGTSAKLHAVTGWAPKVSLEDGLEHMYRYYEANQKHYLGGR